MKPVGDHFPSHRTSFPTAARTLEPGRSMHPEGCGTGRASGPSLVAGGAVLDHDCGKSTRGL